MTTAINRSHRRPQGVTCPDNISRCREALDLTEAELEVVVTLVSAAVVGLGPLTVKAIREKVTRQAPRGFASLVRRMWIESAGLVPRTREQLWRPTVRAFRRLGLQGWEVKLHTQEELEELRRTLPTVTLGFTAPIKVVEEQRTAS